MEEKGKKGSFFSLARDFRLSFVGGIAGLIAKKTLGEGKAREMLGGVPLGPAR